MYFWIVLASSSKTWSERESGDVKEQVRFCLGLLCSPIRWIIQYLLKRNSNPKRIGSPLPNVGDLQYPSQYYGSQYPSQYYGSRSGYYY